MSIKWSQGGEITPNFKVFSEVPSQLLAEVSQSSASSLLTQVSNLTPESLLTQVSNLTPESLLTQVSNLTAGCLVVDVAEVTNLTPENLLVQVSNLTPESLLTQVSNLTAGSLQTTLGARGVLDTSEAITDTGDATFKDAAHQNVIQFSQVTFAVLNTGATNSALAQLMLSADGTNYTLDPTTATQTLTAGSQFFFDPGRFTKYAMIQYASQTDAAATSLTIFYQVHV